MKRTFIGLYILGFSLLIVFIIAPDSGMGVDSEVISFWRYPILITSIIQILIIITAFFLHFIYSFKKGFDKEKLVLLAIMAMLCLIVIPGFLKHSIGFFRRYKISNVSLRELDTEVIQEKE